MSEKVAKVLPNNNDFKDKIDIAQEYEYNENGHVIADKNKGIWPSHPGYQAAGIIFVYLSYESQSDNYVSFDDFKVTHSQTKFFNTTTITLLDYVAQTAGGGRIQRTGSFTMEAVN